MKPSEYILQYAKQTANFGETPEMTLLFSIMKFLDAQHDNK
jgi:hypothetical protein